MSMLNVVTKSMKSWKTAVLIQLLLMHAGHKAASRSKIDWPPNAASCIQYVPRNIFRKFFAILDVTSSYIWAQPQCTSAEKLCNLNGDRLCETVPLLF